MEDSDSRKEGVASFAAHARILGGSIGSGLPASSGDAMPGALPAMRRTGLSPVPSKEFAPSSSCRPTGKEGRNASSPEFGRAFHSDVDADR